MNAGNDPILSADFAERVLARADVLVARRTRIRRVIAGGAVLSFATIAAISWAAMSGAWQPAQKSAPQSVALSSMPARVQSSEPDPLSDLFPDAAPVARFAAEYSDAPEGTDTTLLSDEDESS